MDFKLKKMLLGISLALATVVLTGCPRPETKYVESSLVSTADLGINIQLRQFEGDDIIEVGVRFNQTDGISNLARVDLSESDTLKVSVVDQEVEPLSTDSDYYETFEFSQSSLRLPATFRIQLNRNGLRENAMNTYVTLNALFETTTPADGAIISKDATANFAWTLRDGDGNHVAGANVISAYWSDFHDPEKIYGFRRPYIYGDLDNFTTGLDGYSRMASLPALSLVPAETLGNGAGPWEVDVHLSGDGVATALPAQFEIDPAFANSRTDLFFTNADFVPKNVRVTIR